MNNFQEFCMKNIDTIELSRAYLFIGLVNYGVVKHPNSWIILKMFGGIF